MEIEEPSDSNKYLSRNIYQLAELGIRMQGANIP